MTLDFTSARFLGRGACDAITVPGSGKPSALEEPAGAAAVAQLVAARQGAEGGLLARSTLHALIDILCVEQEGCGGPTIVDEHAYPIALWAAAAARGKEGVVITHRHQDARDAARLLRVHRGQGRAVLVADAWCNGCLEPAPLPDLARLAVRADALLVVDDSLAFGVLGFRRDDRDLLGVDGVGTLAWLGHHDPAIVWVASASKAYGASLCVVTGPHARVAAIQRDGPSRMHAGPPSIADITLLRTQLADARAADRRRRLAGHIHTVRLGCQRAGYLVVGRPFPVVGVRSDRRSAVELHESLATLGVQSLVVRSACHGDPFLAMCLRGDHTDAEIATLLRALTKANRRTV